MQGKIGVVFYDMTTLYFDASEEDDYRIPGFSKDGKHQQPQIMIGLLVSSQGFPIGYKIFEGNTSETKTLIPILEAFQKKFNMDKPVIVADAAPLSLKNIDALNEHGYKYFLGGRVKNETEAIKAEIVQREIEEGKPIEIEGKNGRLIVSYSPKRTHNDNKNREKGLIHRLKRRIEAHICICFAAYSIYKELERLLKYNAIKLSPEKAIDETKEIRQLKYVLPKSHEVKTKILQPNENQAALLNMKI